MMQFTTSVVVALVAMLTLHAGCGSSKSCSVTNNPDGTATIECPDGSKVELATPDDDLACTIADNGDGTSTITCDDGTSVTVSTEGDATCTITDAGDGARKVSCSDGTEVLIPAPGCTSERVDRPTYSFLIQRCPNAEPLVIGVRHVLAQAAPQIVSGRRFGCALRSDGRAGCWGEIDAAPDTRFVHIAAGRGHACGLTALGKAQCWGSNSDGQAAPPASESFSQLALGRTFSCGLRANGSLTCWGEAVPEQPAESFVYLSVQNGAEGSRLFGLRPNGTVLSWNQEGSSGTALDGERFIAWGTGHYHGCGVRLDSTIACTGSFPTNLQVPGNGFVAVDGGYGHACGLRNDGSVVCGGDSSAHGETTSPAGETFVALAAEYDVTCGMRADETVVCWGSDEGGQATPGLPFVCLGDQGPPSSMTQGVAFELWENVVVSALPDFSTLGAPTDTGVLPNFSVPEPGNHFVLRERAWVNLPAGDHSFMLTSDDGSRLYIDGHLVIVHDGIHGVSPPKMGGPFCLDAGWHELVIEMFEANGDEHLSLELSTDGTTFAEIPDAELFH